MSSYKPIIFVIDDDPTVLRSILNILEEVDIYDVHGFTGPENVINNKILKEVDLFIIDVSLKEDNGRELFNKLCLAGIESPALFIAGVIDGDTFGNLNCESIYDFIPKPFPDNKIFLNRVNLLLKVSSKMNAKEEKIRLEEQKLASIVKYSSELINLAGLDGEMVFLNEAGSRMLGIDPEELEDKNILDVIPNHYKDIVNKELIPTLLGGGVWEGDLQYKNIKTDKLVDVHAMTFVIEDINTGKPRYLANVSIDITARKQINETLKQSEEKYKTLFANAGDALFFMAVDPDDRACFIECNQRTLGLFGCDTYDIIGKGPERFSPEFQPDGKSSLEKALELTRLVMEDQPQDFLWLHHRHDNGEPFWVEVNLTRLSLEGNNNYMQAIVRDVTERVEAEREKERINNLFEAVLEQIPFGIDVVEKNGTWRIVKSSNKSKEITGDPNLEKIHSLSYDDCSFRVYHLDGKEMDPMDLPGVKSFLKGVVIEDEELLVVRGDGTEVYVAFKSVPVKNKDGEILAGLQISYDITEYKQIEYLKETEQAKLRTEFEKRLKSWRADIDSTTERSKFRLRELNRQTKKLEESRSV